MKFCPYCGGKITSPEARFCMNCGKALEVFMNQSQAASEPVPETKPVDILEVAAYEYKIAAKSKGTVNKICVNAGKVVNRGDVLLTVTNYFSGEEETISADANAVVKNFAVKVGQIFKPNDILVVLASSSAPAQGDDFFDELNEASANPAGDDFLGEANTALDNEVSVAMTTIIEAENYFMRGEFRRAESLLTPFAGKIYDRANYMLAVMYEYGGDGVEKNEAEAVNLLLSKGDIAAFHFFNFFMDSDNPHYAEMNKIILEHISDFERADHPIIQFEFGYYLGNTRGDMRKFESYLRAADQSGYWLASLYLGFAYRNGVIGQKNFRKACDYFVRAANKGIALAAANAGIIYKYAPEGVTQDLRLAKKYLLIAANQNEAEAMHELAGVYSSEGDFMESIRWLEKNVSTNSYVESAAELGVMLLNINDNPKIRTDYQRSYQFCQFALSKDENSPEALFGMGFHYIAGQAVQADENTARYYLNLAVQKGGSNTVGGMLAQQSLEALKQPPQNQGGCFITTAVCNSFGKPDDCYELTAFRNFRDGWLTAQPDGKSLIAEYYAIAPRIVTGINRLVDAKEIYQNVWQKYLAPCLALLERGDNLACKNKYADMIRDLKRRYL